MGLALLNDSKYGFDVDKNVMSMTIQRSPVYAHHRPYILKTGMEYRYMDQGRHNFKYALVPFAGEWSPAATEKAANLLNVPLTALQDYIHAGKLAQENSFIKIDADNVILTAMKQHEDSEDIIVRVHETDGKKTPTSITIPQIGKTWKGTMKPYEIKTLRFPVKAGECYEIDMIEWDAFK